MCLWPTADFLTVAFVDTKLHTQLLRQIKCLSSVLSQQHEGSSLGKAVGARTPRVRSRPGSDVGGALALSGASPSAVLGFGRSLQDLPRDEHVSDPDL